MYKEGLELKVRFQTTKGLLSIEDLMDLDKKELNTVVIDLEEKYEASKGKSYLRIKTKKDKTLKLMFDIALDILNTKLDKEEDSAAETAIKAEEQRILGLIENKKLEAEGELTIEQLEAKLKALKRK
jgi:hypothetical protein